MTDLEQRVSEALHASAPAAPSTVGLAAGAFRYHRRVQRLTLAAILTAALVVLATVVLIVGILRPPERPLQASPMGRASYCANIMEPTMPPQSPPASPPPVLTAWICPDPSGRSNGAGWRLPDGVLAGQHAEFLAGWLLSPADPRLAPGPDGLGAACGGLRPGPAFTVSLQPYSGAATTYRSGDLPCGGAYLIASFLEALAVQQADESAAASPDAALACRSDRSWTEHHRASLSNSAFVAARMCFAPRYWVGEPDRMIQPILPRSYQSILLPSPTLALLNQDMTSASTGAFYTGNGECLGEGAWSYSVIGQTESGEYRRLETGCLDEMWRTPLARVGFDLSPATTIALRNLVPPR